MVKSRESGSWYWKVGGMSGVYEGLVVGILSVGKRYEFFLMNRYLGQSLGVKDLIKIS